MKPMNTHQKNSSNTIISTIEKKYGRDFGVRPDKKLGNYLQEKGYGPLTQLLNIKDGKSK